MKLTNNTPCQPDFSQALSLESYLPNLHFVMIAHMEACNECDHATPRAPQTHATNPEEEFTREPSVVVENQCNIAVDSAPNQIGGSEEAGLLP